MLASGLTADAKPLYILGLSIFATRAHSLAWQSDRLITGRSGVQTPLGPLYFGFKTL